MTQIVLDLPDEMVADLELVAKSERRTLSDWLTLLLEDRLYGTVRLLPDVGVIPRRTPRLNLTVPIRSAAYKRTGGHCFYCDASLDPFNFEVDHKVSLANGGSNDEENLVACCPRCNRSKGAKNADSFKATKS